MRMMLKLQERLRITAGSNLLKAKIEEAFVISIFFKGSQLPKAAFIEVSFVKQYVASFYIFRKGN
jgi:hypothetical protein